MKRVLAALLAALLLTSCSGGDKPDDKSDDSPADVLAAAKKLLDETSGVSISLTTPKLPDGVTGVTKAVGLATHQPAFEGSIDVPISGIPATVKVVAVNGKVFAQIPFTSGYSEVDPADFNAPDPAALMNTEGGISSWLTDATEVTEGDQTRDGSDVLTSYDGKLAGPSVASVIPSADAKATFDVTFTIDDKGLLHTASVNGPFYAGKPALTYDISVSDYGTDAEISEP